MDKLASTATIASGGKQVADLSGEDEVGVAELVLNLFTHLGTDAACAGLDAEQQDAEQLEVWVGGSDGVEQPGYADHSVEAGFVGSGRDEGVSGRVHREQLELAVARRTVDQDEVVTVSERL